LIPLPAGAAGAAKARVKARIPEITGMTPQAPTRMGMST